MNDKHTLPNPVKLKLPREDIGKFFGSMPPLLLFVLIVVCYGLTVGIGFFFGYQRFQQGFEDPGSPLATAVSAILGLLAFMLGFTFSLTWSRFVKRNILVISQAKALLVCHLRTSWLPEKQKQELRRLFYEYINILIQLQPSIQ